MIQILFVAVLVIISEIILAIGTRKPRQQAQQQHPNEPLQLYVHWFRTTWAMRKTDNWFADPLSLLIIGTIALALLYPLFLLVWIVLAGGFFCGTKEYREVEGNGTR
jgi:hypothetical protein